MKILILNTSEHAGGAAVAANRLMNALHKGGHEVHMLVRDKQTNDPRVVSVNRGFITQKINKFRFVWERFIIFVNNRFSKKNLFAVSIANTGTNISKHPLVKEADVIHIHWVNQGFLSLKNIQQLVALGKPVVWTMHDMWPCTGICHHAYECNYYQNVCGNCFWLHTGKERDLSYRIHRRKEFFQQKNLCFVAVSQWLQLKAKQSSLLEKSEIAIIPNVVDTNIFKPGNKSAVRKELGWAADKKIILMGAAKLNDPVKGFQYLREALSLLTEKQDKNNYSLVLFGAIKNDATFLNNLPVHHIHLGIITDTQHLAKLYQAADITVVPSLYETFGQTLSEAMACGCPVVSFDNSGQTDIINHKVNGYLANWKSGADLAKGIDWTLSEADYNSLSEKAIEKVHSHYAEWIVAGEYLALYESCLSQSLNL